MKITHLLLTVLLAGFAIDGRAQEPAKVSSGRAPARSEFISYELREAAESRQREKSPYYLPLTSKMQNSGSLYTAAVNVPIDWLEREMFLHIEGARPAFTVRVNGKDAGYGEDGRTPYEFNISPYLTDGRNEITVELTKSPGGQLLESSTIPAGTTEGIGEVFIYSQPRTRIEDFSARALAASATGRLNLDIALANSYNYDETISVGYDIYSPSGQLMHYDKREVKLSGSGRDTLRFSQEIRGAGDNLWSPAKPNLYKIMMIVWSHGRIIEYIPAYVGFTAGSFAANLETVGKAKSAGYNVSGAADGIEARTRAELNALKSKGITLLKVSYPQPIFFYDLCDKLGLQVIDQANINCGTPRDDRRMGGTPSNDPRLKEVYLERGRYMFARTANHPCIVAWSPGGESGNGYNMYHSYLLLKSLDGVRPVIYGDAQGEWNSDL